ncbi:hypothetical protein CCUS01_13152 [Colletotrichum cuscutae]|uniref:Uncharacterized protein n=1 Tax=Colletotrichum cuscutae TaxID=1209917 RepID=A0AAI9YCL3_9PEZI|nr:hypothetical protein CCUS01_13152 [Colletotrichum cuscutae]
MAVRQLVSDCSPTPLGERSRRPVDLTFSLLATAPSLVEKRRHEPKNDEPSHKPCHRIMADPACPRDPSLARGEAIKTRPLISLGIAPFTLTGRHMHSICAIFLHGGHPLAVPPEGSPMCYEPDEPANATGIYQAFRRNLGCTTPERENDCTISNMTARTPQMQLQTTMTLSSFEPSSTLELSTFGRSYSRLNQTTVFASPDDRDNPGSSRTSGPPKSPRCGGSNGVLVFGRQAEIT